MPTSYSYTSRLVSIESLVTGALHEGNLEENKYKKLLQFAYRGIRELYRGTMKGSTLMVKKTPDALNRIDFPEDMEEFIALGVPRGGEIYFLTENNDIITTYTEDDEGNLSLTSDDGEGVDLATNQYENIRAEGGVNVYGYFTVDWEQQEIVVNAVTRSEVLLVYSTSGILTDGIQYVPTKAVETLTAWMLWKYYRGKARNNPEMAFADSWERQYTRLRRQLAIRESFSIAEFRDELSRSKSLLRR